MDKRQATEFLGYLLRDKNIERTIYEDALKIAIESLRAQLSKENTTKDAISRQAAIDGKISIQRANGVEIYSDEAVPVEYLKNLPTIQPQSTAGQLNDSAQSTDLIDRQAALDALDKQIKQCCKALGSLCLSDVDKHAVEVEMASLRAYREMLENLPTAQPEPQEGHWIEGKIYRDVIECYCSECGQIMTTAATVRMNYCPNCGADMRGEKDG